MKAKRAFICAGVLAACVVLVLALLATLPFRAGVTKANYDRIEEGMTLAEVQTIFGNEGVIFYGYPTRTEFAYCWENEDHSCAILFFDDNREVVEKAKWSDATESIGDKIRRLIHWRWW